MDIQDLVTANVPESEEKGFTLEDPLIVIEKRRAASFDDVIQILQEAPGRIKSGEDAMYVLIQALVYMQRIPLPRQTRVKLYDPIKVLALAASYSQSPTSNLLEKLRGWFYKREQEISEYKQLRAEQDVLKTTMMQIDFLRDFFEDDLEAEIMHLTRSTKPTARRWIQQGANPAWQNKQRIYNLSRTFYALRHEQNMSNEEVLLWFRSKGNLPFVPRDAFHNEGTYPYGEFATELRRIGVRGDF